ncbi:MFS family permease [Flexivirga oryzae]|uniref:MFS family permease n=1 Tax=Flexivirga oryzae TaxID=1794944 RepID=A0A839NCM6_9MICO|nr:MFS family permease [Flexivirga oryzae]
MGTVLFTLASLGVALAPDFAVLLAGRAVQGLGPALLLPASLALVLAEVPADRRRPAIALWSAAGALAAAVGPAVGGVVVDRLDWRAVFFLHLPIGAWVLWAARGFLAHDARDHRVPDLAGSVLLALSVGALVYGLTEAPGRGWTSPVVLAAFTGAAIAGCGAGVRSLRHEHPALRTDLLWNTSFATATGISTLYGVALFATMLLGVLFLVDVWDYSALRAGLAMTPAAVVTAATGVGISRLRVPLPPRVMICTGALVEAAATTTLALAITGTAHFVSLWLPVGAVMGVGIGLLTVGIQTGGTLAAPPQHFAPQPVC